ncbi:hypothetical protein [Micromonospora sp. 15K316]|uniref:hypothetical protein n=1 Tax=Micromonospora sp. 15K316 TaxID=2530376 RepID=UPI001FB67A01|nr:hypothetical protein [Micromonospora sp. 15K316]
MLAAALFVPGLTACGSDADKSADAGASADASAAAIPSDPKEALVASTKELEKGNFTFTLAGDGVTGEGLVHKPSNSAQMTMKIDDGSGSTMGLDMVYIESESWVKVDLGELADMIPGAAAMKDKYQHLDKSKIQDGALSLDLTKPDPGDSATMIKAITEVQKTGEGAYSGKLDASGVTDSDALDQDLIKALGAQAKSLPFTAKLDAQGRLSELVLSIPAAGETKAHEIKVAYADYGTATAAEKPAADKVVEASEQTYEMLK